ncbi:MAG: pantetheine-phosphate adenylyltransferase [Rhodothermales bacterium]
MKLALYPGTFDPFTFGHLDILERARSIFDRVEVTVAVNADKTSVFTIDERCELIRKCVGHVDRIDVAAHEGLIADRAKETGAIALVRGLRQVSDFDYEMRMALANKELHGDLETVFLPASGRHAFISATIVRDIHRWGGDVSPFVPPPVVDALERKRS